MMRLEGVFAALTLVFAGVATWEYSAASRRQNEIIKLRTQLADTSAKNLADEKVACASRAHAAFRALGYSETGGSVADSDEFTDHYNPTLRRCLIEVSNSSLKFAGPMVTQTIIRTILDVDERTSFGDYAWVSSQTKEMEDQPPIRCVMKPPGHPATRCGTTAEWEAFVKSLMELNVPWPDDAKLSPQVMSP
jgi:hypothetical protein